MYKERKPYRHISEEILKALAVGTAIILVLSSPTGTRRLLRGLHKGWNRQSTHRAIRGLRDKGYIKYQETPDGKLSIILTKLGRHKVCELQLEDLRVIKPKRWDGYWHVIIFDIAEKRKRGRDALRSMLHRLGCFTLQRSIFVHAYPCEEEIELIRDVFNIPKKEILYIRTKDIPLEPRFKKFFDIA